MSAHDGGSTRVLSVYEEATQEAQRHKWIESQKQGRDVGETAIRQWYRDHWLQYCRHRRLEHVEGSRCWREFGNRDFGQLYSLIITGDLLADRILDRVYAGYENLDVINWAIDWGLPTDRVINVLAQLDVNRARLEPRGL